MAVVFTAAVFAQQPLDLPKNEISVWGGYSPDSSTLVKGIGRVKDARFGIVSIRYSRRFNTGSKVNLKYTADLTPAAFLNYPDLGFAGNPPSFRLYRPTRYAFGAAPLGLQMNFRPRKKLQPFIGASGGMLYFAKRTPNYIGTRFAFTADIGGGVEYRLRDRKAFTAGYKYFHISNGDRGIENPGFDNNLFYVGYTFLGW